LDIEVCYRALLFTPFLVFHHLLNVHVQLENKNGLKKKLDTGCPTVIVVSSQKVDFSSEQIRVFIRDF
jgi:hypothetical protein